MTDIHFKDLPLSAALLSSLAQLEYHNMTPIQAQSLPTILAGQDVIGQAQTGSGKTVAFSLGILKRLMVNEYQVQALVLCPTRELADQVANEIRRLAKGIGNVKVLTLCGGVPLRPQAQSLEHGAHIIVGTPGRVLDHLTKGSLNLTDIKSLVLDEADRMLDMGFQDDVESIVDRAGERAQRQTLLFSATYPNAIRSMAKKIMSTPEMIVVESVKSENKIEQFFYPLDTENERLDALLLLLKAHEPKSVVVFCNTKADTHVVTNFLDNRGFSAQALNGDLEQKDRDQTLVQFDNRSITVLVATDVAARGLDIDSIELVVNFSLAHDPEVHIHRVGRTGRAGAKGVACSFYSVKDEYRMALLKDMLGQEITPESLPSEVVLAKPTDKAQMQTLQLDRGKKQKIRKGDILGAITGIDGIAGDQVGKIHIFDNHAYVAVSRVSVKSALHKLKSCKLKGKSFRARLLRLN